MYRLHDPFIRAVLVAAKDNAPIGFDKATLSFEKIKVEWTTIIVGDEALMEVKISEDQDMYYWRVTPLSVALQFYDNWQKEYSC